MGTPFSKREELRLAMNNDILAEQLPALQADDFTVYFSVSFVIFLKISKVGLRELKDINSVLINSYPAAYIFTRDNDDEVKYLSFYPCGPYSSMFESGIDWAFDLV